MSGPSATPGARPDRVEIAPARSLRGEVRVPGDKSISHRSALPGALSHGVSRVEGFLPSADCLSTLACLEKMGVRIERLGEAPQGGLRLAVHGRGPAGLAEPDDVLDCGNSGTTMRLLAGVLAPRPFLAVLTGDGSLRKRPMARVVQPLTRLGARIHGRAKGRYAPLCSLGPSPRVSRDGDGDGDGDDALRPGRLRGAEIRLEVASAQVKSALLLAGLETEGAVAVIEPIATRDHTERMLRARGAPLEVRELPDGGRRVSLQPGARLAAVDQVVPGDPSSAAFLAAAACMVERAEIHVREVCTNPLRTGFFDMLERMGAKIGRANARELGGEPVADLVLGAPDALTGTRVDPHEVPAAIDELPLLAVVGTRARGTTIVHGAAELRVKESDRIETIATELRRMGARIETYPDGFAVEGPTPLRGAEVRSHGDHRIAMALAVAALAAEGPTTIDGADAVDVSFPSFFELLAGLRAAA